MGRFSLNDITTTPDAPPVFRALEREGSNVRRDMNYPKHFAEAQKKAYPKLLPLKSDLPAAQLFEMVQAAALEMPRWAIASVESARLSLEAVAATRFLRLKDDVVIQVRPEADGGSSVHMRSKSRLGRGDFGTNSRRIGAFFALLAEKLRWEKTAG
jgi:uncharacterized protein (DUF1499 family)